MCAGSRATAPLRFVLEGVLEQGLAWPLQGAGQPLNPVVNATLLDHFGHPALRFTDSAGRALSLAASTASPGFQLRGVASQPFGSGSSDARAVLGGGLTIVGPSSVAASVRLTVTWVGLNGKQVTLLRQLSLTLRKCIAGEAYLNGEQCAPCEVSVAVRADHALGSCPDAL